MRASARSRCGATFRRGCAQRSVGPDGSTRVLAMGNRRRWPPMNAGGRTTCIGGRARDCRRCSSGSASQPCRCICSVTATVRRSRCSLRPNMRIAQPRRRCSRHIHLSKRRRSRASNGRAPLLAIEGEDDEYATLAQIDRLAERAPQVRRLVLPARGHAPDRGCADAVISAVAALVDGAQPPSRRAAAPARRVSTARASGSRGWPAARCWPGCRCRGRSCCWSPSW